jgi:23S rRNA U2552 (ribose-2'-O)-methylase RlmE/FtsJ
MIEIATCFNICNVLCDKSTYSIPIRPIQTFHLAEGPGGFIEAIAYLRKCSEDKYIGMTLLSDDDYNIPSWKKSAQFLKENPNVQIESGIDKTGNILSLDNFKYCSQKYKSSMDIITGDGGFDFSVDFNHQESNISKLLFAQIAYALAMQKHKGSFILKIFDSFMQHTIDLIAILSSFYDQIYITKPQTSRSANSEKYIVCLNFIHESNDSFLPQLYTAFEKMANSSNGPDRYLNHNIPSFFITKLEEYNSIFGQMQIDNIHSTLALIDNRFKSDKIESLLKINIQKCIQWCIKYDIQYNNIPTNVNVFTADATNDVRRQSCFSR